MKTLICSNEPNKATHHYAQAVYHNTRNLEFRSPFGAITCGHSLCLRLSVHQSHLATGVYLYTKYNGEETAHRMEKLHGDLYEIQIEAPKTPCILEYFFKVDYFDNGVLYVGDHEDCLGGEGVVYLGNPEYFHITVYDPSFDTPDFMKQGVMYQVFPDRFARSKMPNPKRTNLTLHKNWDDAPEIRVPDETGDGQPIDFFGGDLQGITQKLDYIKSLGVTVLYLNPIFKARSNHRYDTGDYMEIDPMLGTQEDFDILCQTAKEKGIRIVLDGVFSHTGEDSTYFNKYGHYDTVGAYQSKDSIYYPWYTFTDYPEKYESWWGFLTLPRVDKQNESYREYILGDKGVVGHWIERGTGGWRLDVADELPMNFLQKLRTTAKQKDPQSVIIGEVWEDASKKCAYGEMRSYCLGDSLDSVMNYPLRKAVIDFLLQRSPAQALARLINGQMEHYAPPFFYALMNLMGSHDRARIFSILAEQIPHEEYRGEGQQPPLTKEQYTLAKKRFLAFLSILVALPGIPCLYYGDENGMQGGTDPYSRGTYCWLKQDETLISEVSALLHQKHDPLLQTGYLRVEARDKDTLVIKRYFENGHDAFGKAQTQAEKEFIIVR